MKILKPTPKNIQIAAQALRQGHVIGMPTETVYGLAGNAFSNDSLAKIFETKERPTFDPLIIHVSPQLVPISKKIISALEKQKLIKSSLLSKIAKDRLTKLLCRFWPGPLTIVVPKHPAVPDLATSGLPTVAIRMPQHPIAQSLIDRAGFPLAAPSANRFGRISPTSAKNVQQELGNRISYVLDGGPCKIGLESTILYMDLQGQLILLRPGGTPTAEIESFLQSPIQRPSTEATLERSIHPQTAVLSPGLLPTHYAPQKPLYLLPDAFSALLEHPPRLTPLDPLDPKKDCVGLILFSGNPTKAAKEFKKIYGIRCQARVLSPKLNLKKAAFHLFSTLRLLDQSKAKILFCEPCPTLEGLGHAIEDRLERASTRIEA